MFTFKVYRLASTFAIIYLYSVWLHIALFVCIVCVLTFSPNSRDANNGNFQLSILFMTH